MAVTCEICGKSLSKYKCSACFSPYCSLGCFKKHKNGDGCKVEEKLRENDSGLNLAVKKKYFTEDTITDEKLSQLRESAALKRILSNRCLQSTLIAVDNASNPEEALKKAMKDPEFVEFVDECLKIVEDSHD